MVTQLEWPAAIYKISANETCKGSGDSGCGCLLTHAAAVFRGPGAHWSRINEGTPHAVFVRALAKAIEELFDRVGFGVGAALAYHNNLIYCFNDDMSTTGIDRVRVWDRALEICGYTEDTTVAV